MTVTNPTMRVYTITVINTYFSQRAETDILVRATGETAAVHLVESMFPSENFLKFEVRYDAPDA
jgi:hypothetical protein